MPAGLCAAGKQRSDACEIIGRIDSGMRLGGNNADTDAVAVPKRAQLLERLELLKGRRCKARKAGKKVTAIGINANVPENRHACRNRRNSHPQGVPG